MTIKRVMDLMLLCIGLAAVVLVVWLFVAGSDGGQKGQTKPLPAPNAKQATLIGRVADG